MEKSKLPVYSALAANCLIATTKFIAAYVTGSSAMISEGIHSLVDTINEVLLLVGLNRSKKFAASGKLFGYGRELYFWSFVVSILIFSVGGGISFYEGVMHILHPQEIDNPKWNYIVLAFAFLFDGTSLVITMKEFNKRRGTTSFWKAVRKSKDPSIFVVLFEDAADVAGILVAFLGVYIGHKLHNPYVDATGSIIIGFILTFVSIILARETYGLLIGESVDEHMADAIINIANKQPRVDRVERLSSVYLAPEHVMIVLHISFLKSITQKESNEIVSGLKNDIKAAFPIVNRIVVAFGEQS